MKINAILPDKGRDLRLDLFRGVANWWIYLDHIPDNVVNWITARNYGFSDAADLFVFISGYTASFVYARMMLERGFIVGATRLTKRVWQLYVAHIILFVIYIASISYLALRFGDSELVNEFNVVGLIDNATETLRQGLFLKFKPVNLDVLPLYIVLMGLFPPVLWLMLRQPNWTLAAAIALWLVSRQTGWNLSAYPSGTWYFNPFAWQVLFIFGAWCALGGARKNLAIINAPLTIYLCIGYLIFALVMTMAGKFPTFGEMLPAMAVFDVQPQRQDQPRAVPLPALRGDRDPGHPLRAEGVAGPGVEDFRSADRLRSAIIGRVLRRRIPVVRRAFPTVDEFGLAVRADLRQRDRHRDHDRRRLLQFLVEAAGQAAQAAGAESRLSGSRSPAAGFRPAARSRPPVSARRRRR